jgi:hypothetical protein
MPQHLAAHVAAGRHVPGIFIVDPAINVEDLVADLSLIANASFENEHQDRIQYLPFP